MLALDPGVRYIHEPFNVDARPSKLRVPMDHWFQYVCPENEAPWLEPMSEVIRGTYPPRKRSLLWRLRPPRPLLKDPIALMSAPWLADRFACQVVVMIRHPAAFASSLKRLDWRFDFGNWTSQPLFLRDLAGPYAADIASFAERERDIIDQAVLLWNVMHHVIAGYQASHPDWTYVRHEDLSEAPIDGFRRLYATAGLRWTDAVEAAGRREQRQGWPRRGRRRRAEHDGPRQPCRSVDVAPAAHREEQARIREGTSEVAAAFYSDDDWSPR
jgi:hypothetical protein